jgi:hypothetical protein
MNPRKDEYVDPQWLMYACRAERRGMACKRIVLVCAVALIAAGIFFGAVRWARIQVIGTNLPLAPYSIDEATGEVMK